MLRAASNRVGRQDKNTRHITLKLAEYCRFDIATREVKLAGLCGSHGSVYEQ